MILETAGLIEETEVSLKAGCFVEVGSTIGS